MKFRLNLFYFMLLLAVVLLSPLATIWSLNTLFPSLAIDYTFDTWLAVILLLGAGNASIIRKS